MLTESSDTIIAQATPRGVSAVSIIRISGKKSKELFGSLTQKKPEQIKNQQVTSIYDLEKKKIDQALVLFFENPKSFTGEDLLEIQTHGNPLIIKKILDLCLSIDQVRVAEPGEFTQRAFFNQKLDLTQAEAINDLIHTRNNKLLSLANKQLSGQLFSKVQNIIASLQERLVFLQGQLDFPVETEVFDQELNLREFNNSLSEILIQIKNLAENYSKAEILRKGIRTLILGLPNVGKSSLLNLLTKQERAIVTDLAGTTRDFIQEEITIGEIPIILIDTAGLAGQSELEKLSIEKTWSKVKEAELILFLFDLQKGLDSEQEKLILKIKSENSEAKFILVGNKLDLIDKEAQETNSDKIKLSIKENIGIEKLKDKIEELFGFNNSVQDIELEFALNQRHYACLRKATESLEKILEESLQAEIIIFELENAILELKRILGKDSDQDREKLANSIFENFCIGK